MCFRKQRCRDAFLFETTVNKNLNLKAWSIFFWKHWKSWVSICDIYIVFFSRENHSKNKSYSRGKFVAPASGLGDFVRTAADSVIYIFWHIHRHPSPCISSSLLYRFWNELACICVDRNPRPIDIRCPSRAMPLVGADRQLFASYYDKACSVSDGTKIVQLVELMIGLLLKTKEARVKRVHCKSVIPHFANRGGSDLTESKVPR